MTHTLLFTITLDCVKSKLPLTSSEDVQM